MKHCSYRHFFKLFIIYVLSFFLAFSNVTCVFAVPADGEGGEADARPSTYDEPIQSNEIPNWPVGPQIGAEGAILIDAQSGTILYEKNIHEKLYPASTTKILTTLVAIENSNLDDMVTFSRNAVFSIERASSNMGMDAGESITMEQCLYGILVHSANEVANAVAEHIAGDIDSYVEMMNQKAQELGCLNSHFVTTNGLHDDEHYTTAYDLAQIARAFFKNETLAKISGTKYYEIPPTDTQPDLIPCYTHNLITRGEYHCEGYIGGKTGYTSQAHQTLVTCAQRGNLKLICVVMKEESPNQFKDTLTLFDYGFENFEKIQVSDYETRYTSKSTDFFQNENDVFGIEGNLISLDESDTVILPKTITFADLDVNLVLDEGNEDEHHLATLEYSYQNILLGQADILLGSTEKDTYDFESPATEVTQESFHEDTDDQVIFVNVIKIASIALASILVIALIIFIISITRSYNFSGNGFASGGHLRPKRIVVSTPRRRNHVRLWTPKPKDDRIRIVDAREKKWRRKKKQDLHF